MKVKLIAGMLAMMLFCSLASAQDYCVRTNRRINLRDAASLQSIVVETVASGTTLSVIGEYNRWLKINRNENEAWMANWVDYSRLEHCGETQPPQGTPSGIANIDNCCFVDRQCQTDQDWTDGYWAFQNGQCAAPAGSGAPTSSQLVSGAPAQVDSCCFVDRQCSSGQEWAEGYQAFQNNQCQAPSGSGASRSFQVVGRAPRALGKSVLYVGKPDVDLVIEGSAKFIAQVKAALDVLKARAPDWYNYTVAAYDWIFELTGDVIVSTPPDVSVWIFGSDFPYLVDRERFAGTLVHEACHLYQRQVSLESASGLEAERECATRGIEAMEVFSPDHPALPGMRHLLANIDKVEYQWWHGCDYVYWHGDESECD
ncbi:MAG: SH3 domain-containing protein [Chloroflexi bacterium]|nr:SH3 domain-containing protein [Chloroflexota bacterium]